MPFILSVECTADSETGKVPEDVQTLQERLFRREHCGLETFGWTPNFTVICERDIQRERVMQLLSGVGCTVSQERRYVSRQPETGQMRQRSYQPWNSEWEEVPHVSAEAEPAVVPLVAAVSTCVSYEEQVLAFIHELQEILLAHQLAPDDLDALMDEARHLAAAEDEDGPHRRLVIPLKEYLKVHPEAISA